MSATDTEARIAAIRERLASVTPGPWQESPGASDAVISTNPDLVVSADHLGWYGGHFVGESMGPADRALMAQAPADLAWALEEIARLGADNSPRAQARAIIDKLGRIASDLEDGLDRVQRKIDELEKCYPPQPSVFEVVVDGTPWLADGFRVVRDVWPCEYSRREVNPPPSLGTLLDRWNAVVEPVTLVEYASHGYKGNVARFSSGAWVAAEWARELLIGRRFTAHHDARQPKEAVVFRDHEGKLAAAVMPVTLDEHDEAVLQERRAASPAEMVS